jgi:hypothetical protein
MGKYALASTKEMKLLMPSLGRGTIMRSLNFNQIPEEQIKQFDQDGFLMLPTFTGRMKIFTISAA